MVGIDGHLGYHALYTIDSRIMCSDATKLAFKYKSEKGIMERSRNNCSRRLCEQSV